MNIRFRIDDKEVTAEKESTILHAALGAGIYIPHLCYHPDLPSFREILPADKCYRGQENYQSDIQQEESDGCGLCPVEVNGREEPVLSCIVQVEEGMEVYTSTPRVEVIRQEKLISILTHHPHSCLLCAQKEGCSLTQCSANVPENERCCPQFSYCELRKVAEYIGIKENISRYVPRNLYVEKDKPLFLRDYNLCVGCLRCVRVCEKVIGVKALGYVVSGDEIIVGTTKPSPEESGCRFCGACAEICPTGAIRDVEIKAGDRMDALVPCVTSCPVRMDIPSYVRLINKRKYKEAAIVIRESIPMADSLGFICPHPCEEVCRRGEINQAVAVCGLKRFALQESEFPSRVQKEKNTGKRVVVIGSGPAGLVAAYYLAKMGHSVKVYEAEPEAGGMLRWAIPEYRLPTKTIRQEVENIKAVGVEIVTGTPVRSETFRTDLARDSWDAIFIASGAQESKKIEVEGNFLEGVYWGLEFLKRVKEGRIRKIERKLVAIGGGNVALDVAMTALRLSAEKVELACLEKREEMPAFTWEIEEAEEEGVVIHHGWGPAKIVGKDSRVEGIELHACVSVFDREGKFSPKFDHSQKKFLETEAVVLAVGQRPDLSFLPPGLGIELTDTGEIKIKQETLETSVPGIFAGGEVSTGPGSAVKAMVMGKQAASSIDKFLGGKGVLDVTSESRDEEKKDLWMGQEDEFAAKERVSQPSLHLNERLDSFNLVQLGFSEDEAREEASRCLGCDLRFRLSPVILPPEKWLEFNAETISSIPETEGAIQLLDEQKNIIYIAGTPNLKQALEKQLSACTEARYFSYEEDPMYTKRESELIQQYLQKHGCLPPGNEEVDDLF